MDKITEMKLDVLKFESNSQKKQMLSEIRNEVENEYLPEMAVLRKNETGLPVNIFLDDLGICPYSFASLRPGLHSGV